jgi:hypothetical protein
MGTTYFSLNASCTVAMEGTPMSGESAGTSGYLVSAFCSICLIAPLTYVSQPKVLVDRKITHLINIMLNPRITGLLDPSGIRNTREHNV